MSHDASTQTTLAAAEERWRLTFDAARLGTWDWDLESGEVIWNKWHFWLFGLPFEEKTLDFEDFSRGIHPDDRECAAQVVLEAVERGGGFETEFRVVWPDGTVIWILGAGHVTAKSENGAPTRMNGVIRDISERKAAEKALEKARDELEARVEERTSQLREEIEQRQKSEDARGRLMAQLVGAQEEERRRLSRELHDQMGQTLTAILMNLDAAKTAPGNGERLRRARDLTEDLVEQIHRMAWQLRPASLDNVGLEAALKQLCEQLNTSTGIECDVVISGFEKEGARLGSALETALFRVAQESLTNVARHSGAKRAGIVLERSSSQVKLIIEDDGHGFEPGEKSEGRLGLLGMRERIEGVGGTLEIESQSGPAHSGGGTAVFARAPIAEGEKGRRGEGE